MESKWTEKVVKQAFNRFPGKRENTERDIWVDGVNFGAIEKQVEYENKLNFLQAKCERYEKALKVAQVALETCYDVIDFPADGETRQDEAIEEIIQALSGEGEKGVENG